MAPGHPQLRVHQDWIGLLKPVGLVVSPPALLAAQAFPDRNVVREQQVLLSLLTPPSQEGKTSDAPLSPLGFARLAAQVLGWKPDKLVPAELLPDAVTLVLPEFGETLRPTYAVPAPREVGQEGASPWLMLVEELPDGTSFDEPSPEEGRRWHASPQMRLERLLRETGIGIGILANRRQLRLVYAPRGESSGHVTWPLHRLITALDRDMLSALCMLLGSARLFSLPREQRLPHILRESRKYQNVVSTKLAGQVLEALNELLRGFQAANEVSRGALLDAAVLKDPDHVYGGLLAVLLRLVFILYAEERGLLSSSPIYVRNYSLTALFEKLRSDAGRFPDTMDQRYGAWSRLLVLFRMVHDGALCGDLRLPPRHGHLFDPDAWGFLEGRPYGLGRVRGAPVPVPKVNDGVLLRVLERLLLLDGDRLAYRALDVEQIGSVYENMMGFRLERAAETSIGVGKQHVVVGLETLLARKGTEREKCLKNEADVALSGKAAEALKAATSVDDLIAALSRRISPLTPRPVPVGGLYLQPTDERRRSGSHYTPRELTEPVVRATLLPVLKDLGPTPEPEQILSLKVCDPAMGSGAFLVETCRQLAEALVKAYDVHGRPADVPPGEDILLYAQRQVAQRSLYGVDKNPFAVDLGKLSLWLATLARDHAFTFLDHAIRHGDSLVGLSREQIASFHWAPEQQVPVIRGFIDRAITEALELRAKIPGLATSDDVQEKQRLLQEADGALAKVRLVGDAIVAAFFSEEKPAARDAARERFERAVTGWVSTSPPAGAGAMTGLYSSETPRPCFHWEVEFPEVFSRGRPGFDAILGNPPFLAGMRISTNFNRRYLDWIYVQTPGAGSRADLVSYFMRRSWALVRSKGCVGMVTTHTIAYGDTRRATLLPIRQQGGTILFATRPETWPGGAAVVYRLLALRKGDAPGPVMLNGRQVDRITAFLAATGPDEDPVPLLASKALGFSGPYVYGDGLLFADKNPDATPLEHARDLLRMHPEYREVIKDYFGGKEILTSPTQSPNRMVIDLGQLSLPEAEARWPLVVDIAHRKSRPLRALVKRASYRERWWQFAEPQPALRAAMVGKARVLMHAFTSKFLAFVFVPSTAVVGQPHAVLAMDDFASFAVLQSRVHEHWVQYFGSSMASTMRYPVSDVFVTFPFPDDATGWRASLRQVGASYYELRSRTCVHFGEGLTSIYNRFHDPAETREEIMKLRAAHQALDEATLAAYGWNCLTPRPEFLSEVPGDPDEEGSALDGLEAGDTVRLRWPDEVRTEVLARLLDLNMQRRHRTS
ncbi:Eco57I restriction-modification methylase domain-containing protein [Chondromyces apiculatus]|uniref:site-specific DNA-methyltransferase (adenine-specific) n=1 Tax=Chondromyces apiculatus DSM 436 TaxID=1192034 RepID=A0A017TFA1_9BACT|nr:DNA methyltransferase [Chondromyces apiculatus]EYF07495.1 Hypothetical protein CAP_0248 [Chondromyces apiculatus DSM 436]